MYGRYFQSSSVPFGHGHRVDRISGLTSLVKKQTTPYAPMIISFRRGGWVMSQPFPWVGFDGYGPKDKQKFSLMVILMVYVL